MYVYQSNLSNWKMISDSNVQYVHSNCKRVDKSDKQLNWQAY